MSALNYWRQESTSLSLVTAQCRRRVRDVTKPAHSNFKHSYRQNRRLFEIENWFSRLLIYVRISEYNNSIPFSFNFYIKIKLLVWWWQSAGTAFCHAMLAKRCRPGIWSVLTRQCQPVTSASIFAKSADPAPSQHFSVYLGICMLK